MEKKNYPILVFLLLFSSFVTCDQPQQHQSQTIPQRLYSWWQKQQRRAHHNKMQHDATVIVGPVVRAHYMSEGDRQRSKQILLALSNVAKKAQGNPAMYSFIKRGAYDTYLQTDLKKEFDECDDRDATLELLHHVCQNSPGLYHYTLSDRSVKTLVRVAQELGTIAQLKIEIYQLPNDERVQLIEQLQQQNQPEFAQVISAVGSLSEKEIARELAQLQMAFNKVQRYGIQHTNMQRWNEDCSAWLAHCAHALDSKTLPSTQEITMCQQAQKEWKDLCNGLARVREYDYCTRQYFATMNALIPAHEDWVQKLSERKQGLELLGADNATTEKSIHKAYKKASLTCHPDQHEKGGSEEKFKILGAAEDYKKKHPKVRVADVQAEIDYHQDIVATLENHSRETERYYQKERKALLGSIHLRSAIRPIRSYYPPHLPRIPNNR